jgi:hypothetical protein
VTSPNQRSALAALNHVRPIIARLDASRHPEDIAADLIEGWNGTEVALRSLLGGSALSGQGLIRELRQREMLSLAQTHALMEFLAARERAGRTEYTPTGADVGAARHGFQELEGALTLPVTGDIPVAASAQVPEPSQVTVVGTRRRPSRMIALAVVVLLVLGVGGLLAYQAYGNRNRNITAEGERHLAAGNRGAARQAFEDAAREHPRAARPHIFLGRMSRDEGDIRRATDELSRAIELEPGNSLAQREMGALQFLRGNYPLASSFYTRAIERNPEDRISMGWLACAQARMGRMDAAIRFFDRAGPGDWTACDPRRRLP